MFNQELKLTKIDTWLLFRSLQRHIFAVCILDFMWVLVEHWQLRDVFIRVDFDYLVNCSLPEGAIAKQLGVSIWTHLKFLFELIDFCLRIHIQLCNRWFRLFSWSMSALCLPTNVHSSSESRLLLQDRSEAWLFLARLIAWFVEKLGNLRVLLINANLRWKVGLKSFSSPTRRFFYRMPLATVGAEVHALSTIRMRHGLPPDWLLAFQC